MLELMREEVILDITLYGTKDLVQDIGAVEHQYGTLTIVLSSSLYM